MPTLGAPSKNWYAVTNLALASVASAAAAANSYIHAKVKALQGQNHGAFANFGAIVSGAFSAVLPPASACWTMVSSSNGTVAGAGDNFNNTFNNAEFPANTAGNAHMWAQMQCPAGMLDAPWYALIAKDGATATSWTVAISRTAWTGGSTTANPTNAGVVCSTGNVQHFHASALTTGKVHMVIDANGSFWFLSSRDASGIVDSFDSLHELLDTQPSGDTGGRAVGYCGYNASGLFSGIHGGSNISGAPILGFHRNGAAVSSSNMVIVSRNLSGFTELNGINGQAEGFQYGEILTTLAGSMITKGRIPDLYQMTTALVNASANPNPSAPLWTPLGSASTGGKVAFPIAAPLSL